MITKEDFKLVEAGIGLLLYILVNSDDVNERRNAATLLRDGLKLVEDALAD